ncbi:hypothetical protein [Sphaerisporangium sp. NPDC051011]|uniref:hypothetical protein n=1 Tax=Sphaerisporangium sp. NPDC051011 TaxID=3155792 RepID=UPI003409CADD
MIYPNPTKAVSFRPAAPRHSQVSQVIISNVGTSAPDLLPIFRSRFQADLLARVYLAAGQEFSISDLATGLGHPVSTTQREVDRLVAAALLRERRIGRTRLVRANTEASTYRPLAQLLAVSFGAPAIIAEEFADIPGIHELVVFGSWAARYRGEPGPQPRDVDLLVIGSPPRGDVYDSAERAEQRIELSVNPVIRSVSAWESGTDGLIQQIKGSPTFQIDRHQKVGDNSAVDSG